MTRVLVAAANLIVCAGLKSLVAEGAGLEVVGSCFDLNSLEDCIRDNLPDVILADLGSSNDDSTIPEALAIDNKGADSPEIVVLVDDRDEWVAELLRVGVHAVLSRSAATEEIIAAIAAVANKLIVLHPSFLNELLGTSLAIAHPPTSLPLEPLTAREIEILGMLAEGLGNKAIAQKLNISNHTVKFHVSSIFSKLNAQSRTEAVTLGIRLGLILL